MVHKASFENCYNMAKMEKVPFEEAMDLTGFGKFNFLTFVLCSSIIMSMVFEVFSVAFLVPASACELMTSSSQQGLMAGTPLIGIIAFSNMWGYLADTRGRKRILLISMTMAFIAGAMAAFSPNWIFFSLFKLLSSGSVAGGFALSLTLLSECNPMNKRFMLLVLNTSVFLSCSGLMAVLTIPVLPLDFSYYIPVLKIHFNSWRLLDLIFCLPSGLSLIGLMYAYESPKYLMSVGEEEKTLEVLRNMFVINNNKSRDEYPVKSLTLNEGSNAQASAGFWASIVAQTVPLFKPPLLRNTLLLSLVFVIVYITINPYMVWLPFIADGFMKSVERGDEGMTFCQRLQASTNTTNVEVQNDCSLNTFAMILLFIIYVLLAVVNALITFLMKFIDKRTIFISLQILVGLAALLMNISTSWVVVALLFFVYLAGVINFGFLTTFTVDVFPTYVKAMAVCLSLMIGRGSAVYGINLLKQLLDTNCEASFYICGSITIVGGLLGFLLPKGRKPTQRKCPET